MAETDAHNISSTLQNEFPDLDGSLVAALALDFGNLDLAREQCSLLYYEMLVDKADERQRGSDANDTDDSSDDTNQDFMSWDTDSTADETPIDIMDRKSPDEKFHFMMNSFPTLSKDRLNAVLEERNFDLSKAIDEALSLLYLNEFGSQFSSSTSLSSLSGSSRSISEKDWTSVTKKKKRDRNAIKAISKAYDQSESTWKIASLLGMSVHNVSKAYELYPNKPVTALLHLINYASRAPVTTWSKPPNRESKHAQETLKSIIPTLPDTLYAKVLACTANNIDKATELSIFLIESSLESKEDISFVESAATNSTFHSKQGSKKISSSQSSGLIKKSLSSDFSSGFTEVINTKKERQLIVRERSIESPSRTPGSTNYQDLIQEKAVAREEARAKARDLYKRRNTSNMHSGAATYYAEISKNLNNDIEALRLDYARAKVEKTYED